MGGSVQTLLLGALVGALSVVFALYIVPRQLLAALAGRQYGYLPLKSQLRARHAERLFPPPPPPPLSPADLLPLAWRPVLQQLQTRRGLAYYGSGIRVEHLISRLQSGQPIVAATIGGSVSWGVGSSNRSTTSYPARLFQFLNATFPHRHHDFSNRAISATNSGTFATCTDQLVPKDAHLLVLEFTMNEPPGLPYMSPHRMAFEQLLRRLLRLPNAPVVVLLQHYAWYHSRGDGLQAGMFQYSTEEHLATLAQYYDMPVVSLRDAIYPELQADVAPFKRSKVHVRNREAIDAGVLQCSVKNCGHYFYYDSVHPADHGHKALAELLASLLRQAAQNVAAAGGPAAILNSFHGGSSRRSRREEEGGTEVQELPPPMIAGNTDDATTLCALQEEFRPLAVSMDGFGWEAERPNKTTYVEQKWGYTAHHTGAWIELQLSTMTDGGKKKAMLLLSHLKSYAGMGLALAECKEGCTCKPSLVDGYWSYEASLTQMHKLMVTQHPRCRMRITTVPRAANDPGAADAAKHSAAFSIGEKFKLNGVMVAVGMPGLQGFPEQAAQLEEKVG